MIDIIFPIYVCDEENAAIQEECFESLLSTVERQYINLIIVDNGSIVVAAERANDTADIYVSFPRPVGFAKAVNTGWKFCQNDICIVANNDLIFKPGWLDPLLLRVDCATVVAPSEAPFEGESDEIWSSCFVMRRKVREKIGFFDELNLPYRYHDQDYWIRAKKAGVAFKRLGNSIVGHKESTTFKKMPNREDYIKKEEEIMRARYGVVMAAHFK